MAKKPPFTIVSPNTTGGEPPRDLGKHGRQLWDRIQRQYGIKDEGGIEQLAQACAMEDRAEKLHEDVEHDGAVLRSRTGGVRVHPAVKEELACRSFVVRTLQRLGLDPENDSEPRRGLGRPPRPLDWTGD